MNSSQDQNVVCVVEDLGIDKGLSHVARINALRIALRSEPNGEVSDAIESEIRRLEVLIPNVSLTVGGGA